MDILIRDGGESNNILRLKFSEQISTKHFDGLVDFYRNLYRNYASIGEWSGSVVKKLIEDIFDAVPEVQRVGIRPRQVVIDLGIDNKWSTLQEASVREVVEVAFLGKSICWSVQRKVEDTPMPLRPEQV